MDKNIGFRRNIYHSWLDAAAAIAAEESDPARVRERLDPVVAEQVASKENRRMALDILLNIWVKTGEAHPALRNEALTLFRESEALDDRLWLHYGLTLLYYPFFRLGTVAIGQMAEYADAITPKDVKKRLTAELGQLGALEKATERIIFSLRDWGILAPTRQRYAYAPRRHALVTTDKRLQLWLLVVALTAHTADELPFPDLARLPELFPFQFTVGIQDVRRSSHFEVHRQGLGWDMVAVRRERPPSTTLLQHIAGADGNAANSNGTPAPRRRSRPSAAGLTSRAARTK
jgi:hypothetical protein